MGSFKGIWFQNWNEMQQKGEDDRQRQRIGKRIRGRGAQMHKNICVGRKNNDNMHRELKEETSTDLGQKNGKIREGIGKVQADSRRLSAESNGTSILCNTSTDLRFRAHAPHGDNLDEAGKCTRCSSNPRDGDLRLTFTLLARGHLVHPGQAVRYCDITTVRRVLHQRTDLHENVKELIRTKEDKEEGPEEARGPVSVLLQHMKMLGWTLSDQLVITRKEKVSCLIIDSEGT